MTTCSLKEKQKFTIVLTGGPCAGKTSAMEALRAYFEQAGISAYFVAEAATDLILDGISPQSCGRMYYFQQHVMKLQLEREAQAQTSDADVIVCDRGICDGYAYLTDDEYDEVLEICGLSEVGALARYDAVIHLETIAKSHPETYTTSNNTARSEDAEEAIALDNRVLAGWSKHPNLHVIGSYDSFVEKAEAIISVVVSLIDEMK